jgi:RNA polymerase sigma factor (sigma-70 family)
MSEVLGHLRKAMLRQQRVALTDQQLLEDYLSRQDEAPLATIVQRHGPMVWGVCRRVLPNYHDAEDAFQATFLVLVRKAASIASRELLANWLYGVAHQTARKARATATKRCARERQVTKMPEPTATEQDLWSDLRPLLDEELSRLPDKYRVVLVLCDLEGRTRKEVASQFGCPEGTVASRLSKARKMLARRLAARGVALSGGAAVLFQNMASAAVPASVVASTIKAASHCAAGQAATPVKVAALAEGVLKAMLMSKLKAAVAVVLVLGLMAIGAAVLTSRTASAQGDKPPIAEEQVKGQLKVEEREDAAIAWGKEVDGLQAGLYLAGARTYGWGEKVKLEVKLRNVGKTPVTIKYGILEEYAPRITDSKGRQLDVTMPPIPLYLVIPTEQVIKPGEIIHLYNPEVTLVSEAQQRMRGLMQVDTPMISIAPGKYKIAYGGMLQSHPKLKTGTVGFEVKEPAKPVAKDDVAWGKEAGGLQAGIVGPGSVRIGEKARFAVKLRNVGKADVKVTHGRLTECPPAVTNSEGKISVFMPPLLGIYAVPTERIIKPAEIVTLYNPEVAVQPEALMRLDGLMRVDTPTICVTPGKYRIAYGGMIQSHPKLKTGTVEFEVKAAIPADKQQNPKSEYPTADIVVQYRDETGREVRDLKQFRVDDAETVAKLASHFPGILGDRGSGPRTSAGKRATFTIKFNHKSGEASQLRVAHVTADYATWWWRDNTPYTGDRTVKGKDQFRKLVEQLAAKHNIPLK